MAFTPDVSAFVNAVSKLSDAEKLQYSNLIFRDYIQAGEISQVLDIRTGIQANDPIPIMDRNNDWEYMKDASGLTSQCDDLPCDVSVTNSVVTWNPAPYACTMEICTRDLDVVMLDYFNSVRLLDQFDENAFYVNFIEFLIADRLKKSLWAKAYFAATTATSTALTGHDGLFVQYDAATTGGGASRRVSIAKNGGASYAAQKLTGQEGFDALNAVIEAVEDDRELSGRNDIEILTTRTVASAYLRWLRENKQTNCCERDPQTGLYTINSLSMWAKPIRVVQEWDDIINAIGDFNTGTAHVNPHRIVATYKGSSLLGTPMSEKLEEIELDYDSYSKKAKFSSRYRVDSKLAIPEHVVLGM